MFSKLLISLLVLYNFLCVKSQNCNEVLNRGHSNCENPQKSITYYFDNNLEICLPFLYEGCGGNNNRFESEDLCSMRCRPADKGSCGGGAKSLANCSTRNKKCPAGSKCVKMAFGLGICCDAKIQEEWMKEIRPKCHRSDEKVVTQNAWYGEQEVIGRRCEHKFCPENSRCVEGKWLAHCCLKR